MDMQVIGQGGQTNLNISSQLNMDVTTVKIEENKEEQESRYTKDNLNKAVQKLNGFLQGDNAYAEYNVHDKFGDIMIKIVDKETKEVLIEVPPKKILDMVAKLCEISGVVFDKKA